MKKKFSFLCLIAIVFSLLLIKFVLGNKKSDFEVFTLKKEPDGIFSSSYTNDLFVITDGSLTVYDENGGYRDINLDYKLNSVIPAKDEIWVLDANNNLYNVELTGTESTLVLHDIIDFSVASNSFAAITKSGNLYVWGENSFYMLGIGEKSNIEKPIIVNYIQNPLKIVLGNQYALLLDKSGQVYECGLLDYKIIQSKENDPVYISTFQPIDKLLNVRSLISGYGNIAITNDGNTHYWFRGFNSNQININLNDLSEISDKCKYAGIKEYSAGARFYLGINDNGEVYYWGQDIINKSNDKSIKWVSTPTMIKQVSNAEAVYAGKNIGYVKKGMDIIILKS